MTEGGRVQQESAATPGSTSGLAHVLLAGRVDYGLSPRRKQVPSASLFPHQQPRKNKTNTKKKMG